MAHTLTFGSEFNVLVNDVVVSSPYTLQNGDVITIQIDTNTGAGYAFYADYGYNSKMPLSTDNPPNFSVSDSDIALTATTGGTND